MGLVKRHLDDLTYIIMARLDIEDDDEGKNHDKVFQWVMDNQQHLRMTNSQIIDQYKKEIISLP
jgi:hypothetical protein